MEEENSSGSQRIQTRRKDEGGRFPTTWAGTEARSGRGRSAVRKGDRLASLLAGGRALAVAARRRRLGSPQRSARWPPWARHVALTTAPNTSAAGRGGRRRGSGESGGSGTEKPPRSFPGSPPPSSSSSSSPPLKNGPHKDAPARTHPASGGWLKLRACGAKGKRCRRFLRKFSRWKTGPGTRAARGAGESSAAAWGLSRFREESKMSRRLPERARPPRRRKLVENEIGEEQKRIRWACERAISLILKWRQRGDADILGL